MEFRIADSFTSSLARLTGEEQKAAKTTAFDLQMNPASPGLSFHKLDGARDKNFWSVRVSRDIRLIVHRTTDSVLLCYVDHHDQAYAWAERRKLEVHPRTGAAQFVEIRERVAEIVVPRYVEATEAGARSVAAASPSPAPSASSPLFAASTDEELLAYGVPQDWLDAVRDVDEDGLLKLSDHLPAEAAEALLELATGGRPAVRRAAAGADPFAHPDAQRRFRLMADVEALKRALDYPWDQWTVFLHPAQREWVERDYPGPARVSGSAGTGKTIVALHRAAYLARTNPDSRVLLTTFSDALANALSTRLRRLVGNEPRLAERIDVHSMTAIGERLYELHFGRPSMAAVSTIKAYLADAARADLPQKFSPGFLLGEWTEIVDAWQLRTWDEYRDAKRLGRKTRLPAQQRATLWSVFEAMIDRMRKAGLLTHAGVFFRLTEKMQALKQSPFDFVVVDEAQDISVPHLRFLASLGADKPNRLFFAGDLGQRIFQQPFSWLSLGVDVRGRSRTLHVNYRTSHQIRSQADRLLGPQVADVDGNIQDRRGTVSAFNGPLPTVRVLAGSDQEIAVVGSWLAERVQEGVAPHEIGIIVRSAAELARARAAAGTAKLPVVELDERVRVQSGSAAVCTMHLAKGLEFRSVAVMACDDEIVPLQSRIESVADDSDLEEVYNTERHLLYVACTRARDHLLVTSAGAASEFLEDLVAPQTGKITSTVSKATKPG